MSSKIDEATPTADKMWQDTRSTKKKTIALLYTNDKGAEKEIRETSPFQ